MTGSVTSGIALVRYTRGTLYPGYLFVFHPYFAFFPTNFRTKETARGLHREKRYEYYYRYTQRLVNTKKKRASKYLQLNAKSGSQARLLVQFFNSTIWEVDSSVKL